MSSKRRALGQLTKDGDGGVDSDSDQDVRSQAPAAIMSQRKLAVPRGRTPGQTGVGSNPFASLKAQPRGTEPPPNPFASIARKPTEDNTTLRLRALNEKFAETVARLVRDSPNTSWAQTCESYVRYYKLIEQEATPEPSLQSVDSSDSKAKEPVPAKAEENSSVVMKDNTDSESSESEEEGDTREGLEATGDNPFKNGFKFSGGSSSGSDKFAFGGKVVDVSSKHSKSTSSGGFVFEGGKGKINFGEVPEGSSFAAEPTRSDDGKEGAAPTKAPDSSLEEPHKAVESKPLFDFAIAKEEANSQSKPTFTFGGTPSKDTESKPVFSFEKPSDKIEQSTDTRSPQAFSFSKPDNHEASKSVSAEKKPFSFSSTASQTESKSGSKPLFNFSSRPDNDKAEFKFGSNSGNTSGFTFGSAEKDTKPSINLSSKPGDDKPAFSFSSNSGNEKPAFSFASNSGDEKPAFSFGSGKFTFGQQGGNSPFTFGKSANPFGQSSETATWKPGQKVEIEKPEEGAQPAEPEESAGDQANLDGPGPGEEDEDAVFEHRSKAYVSEQNQYKSLGVGQLRILKNRENGSARALLRSEGGGRPLLNIPLKKGLEYPITGKTNIQVMDPAAENGPKAYLVRVKTEADAKQLKEKIDEVKA